MLISSSQISPQVKHLHDKEAYTHTFVQNDIFFNILLLIVARSPPSFYYLTSDCSS